MLFADIGLSDELLQAVTEAGYTEPTPIQEQAIPPVLMMKDIIGIAQTGTGKTASFVLPMIDILAQGRARARMPRSLILEPTRELAAQVAENFEKYGKYHKLSMALLIGGVSMGDQVKALEKGVDVLIATPGHLMDLFGRGNILLNGCDLLVIDEADRMLDMGFIPDIEEICTKLPAQRQTLLFSATMPPPIKKLSDKFLDNPKYIEVARPATANTNIDQKLVEVAPNRKRDMLRKMLRAEEVETGIIFCNRKTTVRDLNQSLNRDGFRAGEIHGDIDQATRQKQLEMFKTGEINLLVASDVAARGLDIKGVSHVFNYDAPWHPDDYVHRIGRTGRAGASGKAITFVTKADAEALENIEKLIGSKIERAGDKPAAKKSDGKKSDGKKRDSKKSDSDAPAKNRGRAEDKPAPKHSGRWKKADVVEDQSAAKTKPKRASKPEDEVKAEPKADEPKAKKPKADKPKSSRQDDKNNAKNGKGDDDGWNGPMPDFLGVGFRG